MMPAIVHQMPNPVLSHHPGAGPRTRKAYADPQEIENQVRSESYDHARKHSAP